MMRQFWIIHDPAWCNNNGKCETWEDCHSCPNDCATTTRAVCGNGICEAGKQECSLVRQG